MSRSASGIEGKYSVKEAARSAPRGMSRIENPRPASKSSIATAVPPTLAPAVAPPAPRTSSDVMALHSTYGNSAVARAAGAGAIAIAPERSAPMPVAVAPTHAAPQSVLAALTATAAPIPAAPTPAGVQAPSGSAPPGKSAGAPAGAASRATAAKVAALQGREAAGSKAESGGSAEAAPAAPQASGPASPQADPAFAAVVHHVQIAAKHQIAHAPASSKAAAAHAAVVSPSNEVPSRAAAKQTDAMDQQKPKPFNRAAFKQALLEKIKATAPKTLEAAADFKENNNLGAVKSDLTSEVTQEKAESQGALPDTVAAQPDQSGITQTASTPLPPSDTGGVSPIAAAGAAPKPASEEQVSLQAGPQELNRQMADANVTEEQLKDSNEPAFQSALGQKKSVEAESAAAPKAFRAEEKGLLHHAQSEAQGVATKHAAEMHGVRKHAFGAVATHQSEAKEEEEKQRDKIYGAIDKIYESTKKNVEARLQKLDKDVNDTFDSGATDAQKQFEDHVDARMSAYKDDRYSGLSGKALWIKDKFADLPSEVNVFYEEGHDIYVDKMGAVIDQVAGTVETGLNEAKALVTAGKAEIQTFLGSLSPAWQATGKKAAAGIQAKFAALEQGITDKQDQLVDSLAKKYNDNLQKVNQRIEQMKEANRGLVSKAVDAVKGAIRAIIELKNMLLNVLARAADAIGSIIAHPINFLGHLVDAGKLGFSNFSAHIVEHLKAGFMEWLFGAVASAGIQLPKNFDLRGILSLVLQILGLTYPNIRSRAVKILGEKVVKALETAAEIFKILITQGPAGLWEYIKEKIGDLKTLVIEKIKSFVMEKIVIAGITWLIGLLNPASAFIKACKAIYDIVMFFVERGKQILDLVNAIIDSITAVAKGAIGAAANFVESSLARTIPVIIGFLASLLGVGGISEKIKEIIEDIRKPINEAIDWVINKAVDLVKAVGGLLGFGKKEEPVAKTADPEHDAKVTAGLVALDAADAEREKNGPVTQKDAEAIAAHVKEQHPVFTSISVVDGGQTWDYDYTASPGTKRKGAFKGANPDVLKGIKQLQSYLASDTFPYQYRAGIAAQLARAEQLFNTGRLVGVEMTLPQKMGRIDFKLKDPDQVIEFKYWTKGYTEDNVRKLANQLIKYQSTKKPVILELGITKTDPISIEYVDNTLRAKLEDLGLTFGTMNIYVHEQIISVEISLIPPPE